MKAQNLEQKQATHRKVYQWDLNDITKAGFSFDCDESGETLFFKCIEAESNYKMCLEKVAAGEMHFIGIEGAYLKTNKWLNALAKSQLVPNV